MRRLLTLTALAAALGLAAGCRQNDATQTQQSCARNVCALPQNAGACGDPEMQRTLVTAACGPVKAAAAE